MKKTAELKLTAVFDRDLVWEQGGSVRYLVVSIEGRKPEKTKTEARKPLNIALVIDASGSMSGDKLEAAKEATRGLIRQMSGQDRITLVSFADDVIVHTDAQPVTPETVRKIDAELLQLQTRGMTNLSNGWFSGVDCACRVAESNPVLRARVVLLSDGHANGGIVDSSELTMHAKQLRIRGVTTSTLGIGNGYDEHLLQAIAENGGGRMHDAERADDISVVLLGELGEVLGTAVEETILKIEAPKNVRVEAYGTAQPSRSRDRSELAVGALSNGVSRDVVLKVTCPEGAPADFLSFLISAEGVCAETQEQLRTGPATLALTFSESARNSAQIRNDGLAHRIATAWHAHILRNSSQLNRDAAGPEAEKFVDGELQHFSRYVDGYEFGWDMVGEIQKIRDRIGRRWSERTRKEMSFHAARVMESRQDFRGEETMDFSECLDLEDVVPGR